MSVTMKCKAILALCFNTCLYEIMLLQLLFLLIIFSLI